MSSKPTIHVTNWSSRKLHGPGRKFTIMARPRHFERGDGFIFRFVPEVDLLAGVMEGSVTMETYRRRFIERALWRQEELPPGRLMAIKHPAGLLGPVADGDTLCCACSKAAAARGECHRVWAAELLANAGWRVILDGQEVETICETD